jgi:ABC-type multidrug transport system fused ATPase/permease subunit
MIRALVFSAILSLVGLFALLNWTAFTATTPLSLGYTTVNAPLGLILLGLLVFMTVLFTMWAISLQASVMMEIRRYARKMQVQRDLVEKAETSRFTELRSYLSLEQQRLTQTNDEMRAAILMRLNRMEEEIRSRLDHATNSLSSYIGEMEDRLEHHYQRPQADAAINDVPAQRR